MISLMDRIKGALICLRGDALVFGVRWRYHEDGISRFRPRHGREVLAIATLVEIFDADERRDGVVRFPQPWRVRTVPGNSEFEERRAARHRHPSGPGGPA